jgi:hypothetical protein
VALRIDHAVVVSLFIVGKRQLVQYNKEVDDNKERNLDKLQERLDQLMSRVNAAKIAYLNKTPFDDKTELSYEDLKHITQQFIQASYEFQKQKYGSVKVKISVAKLLRR